MTPRRAITVLFKLLVAIALGYCIATTLFVWLGATGQQRQFPEGGGSLLLWCSLAISIL
jgi:hypothetical protein